MSCDGPRYEHMDEQGIVALISGDNKKKRLMRVLKINMMFPKHLSVRSLMLKPCKKWMIT